MDLSSRLSQLDSLHELDQLHLLLEEIQHILYHEFSPPAEWYGMRATKLECYDTLNWREFADTFYQKNEQLYSLGHRIRMRLDQLLQEWEEGHAFSLYTYGMMLNDIHALWTHYSTHYVGMETDDDVLDLIRDMTHL